jgi:hypothetical protein
VNLKPICIPCQRFFKPEKNGQMVEERKPTTNEARPGKDDAHLWDSYKLWMTDRWKCPGCHSEIICGAGRDPICISHQPDYEKVRGWEPNIVIVNDC